MERKIANIDEFQVDENGIPLFPAGLKEEANLYVLPDERYLPCGVYRTEDGGHSFMRHPGSASSGRCLLNSQKAIGLIAR